MYQIREHEPRALMHISGCSTNRQALKSIAITDLEPCSAQGIEQMRMIAMNTFSVETVGYEEDVFACTSWGTTLPRSKKWAEDFVTDDGVKVSLDAQDDRCQKQSFERE